MAGKTNAVRIVEQAGFQFKEAFYEYDENDLNGNHAAEAIGMPPEQVFKTLVARGESGLDLIANAVIVTHRGMLNGDVGVELVELGDVGVKNILKLLTHGVIEGDSYGTSVVALCGYFVSYLVCAVSAVFAFIAVFVTADHCNGADKHRENEEERDDSLFHF